MNDRRVERQVQARTAVVWDVLATHLGETPCDVVDIGGGTGVSAVRIAELGHRVRVVDPSPNALAGLQRRSDELGVSVEGRQGDLSELLDIVEPASADIVLCHGVLEVVPDPDAALGAIAAVLRPGGVLSLLVGQRSAAVLARALGGHFTDALDLLDDAEPRGRSGRRFSQDDVTSALARAGYQVDGVHGVRVFTDVVPGSVLDLEPESALIDLERAVAQRPEYLPLATQLHVTARVPR